MIEDMRSIHLHTDHYNGRVRLPSLRFGRNLLLERRTRNRGWEVDLEERKRLKSPTMRSEMKMEETGMKKKKKERKKKARDEHGFCCKSSWLSILLRSAKLERDQIAKLAKLAYLVLWAAFADRASE
jgi:hypothetical protein